MSGAAGAVGAAGDDLALVAAAGSDASAFNRLVLRYQDAVYTLCFRLTGNAQDAEDAAQETFLSAYYHLADFRGGVFRSWLLRIAANSAYDVQRRRKRRPSDSLDRSRATHEGNQAPPLEAAHPSPGPEALALQQEFDHVLQAGLLELPKDQRLAVVLCDLHEFDYQTIAMMTGTELGTVKSRISRGRRRLRDYLRGHRELLPPSFRLE